MLNAARPYIDVTLDKQGYPLVIQPRDFFTFMEAHVAHNNRTPNVTERALVLEGMSTRVMHDVHRQSGVGQKAGIRTSGPAFCPWLSAFVTWNGGPNSNIRSCVVEGRNPEYGGFYIVHVDPAFCPDPFRG